MSRHTNVVSNKLSPGLLALLLATGSGGALLSGCSQDEPNRADVRVESPQEKEDDADFSLKFKNQDGSIEIKDKD